jgi:hypothetical protein
MKESLEIRGREKEKTYQRGKALISMASKHRETTMCAGI